MTGTTTIDFAGSKKEARLFAETHEHVFPHPPTLGRGSGEESPNGDAVLFFAWKNGDERGQVRDSLKELGWDEGSQREIVHSPKKHAAS